MQTTFMPLSAEMELQQKKMNLAALSSMQGYIKQLISLSILQEELKNNTKLMIHPMSSIPSISRMNSQLAEFNQLIQPINSQPTQEFSQALTKCPEVNVKCEEEEPAKQVQVKIEQIDEEVNRKTDIDSNNSSDMDIQHQESRAQPLFNLFPQKQKQLACPHPWRKHHAKGLCKKCYEKFGRTKKPTNCEHEIHFARGYCRKCYFRTFKKNDRYDPQIYNELKMKLAGLKKRF